MVTGKTSVKRIKLSRNTKAVLSHGKANEGCAHSLKAFLWFKYTKNDKGAFACFEGGVLFVFLTESSCHGCIGPCFILQKQLIFDG